MLVPAVPPLDLPSPSAPVLPWPGPSCPSAATMEPPLPAAFPLEPGWRQMPRDRGAQAHHPGKCSPANPGNARSSRTPAVLSLLLPREQGGC